MKFIYLLTSSVMILSTVGCTSNGAKSANAENPFFAAQWTENYGIPPFNTIKDEHFLPAIEEGITLHNKEIEVIVTSRAAATFENTIEAYVNAGEFLQRATGVFENLTESDLTEERSVLQEKINPMLSTHYNTISLNEGLFTKIKSVYDNQASMNLSKEQTRLLKKIFDNFARNGANLDATAKIRYKELCERETLLTMQYGNNLLKENAAFSLVVDNETDLAGLPESSVVAAAEMAKAKGMEGKWMFNLSYPSYVPFMSFAANRGLRQKMFEGYSTRGFKDNERNNTKIIEELSNLRVEKAKLLGFESHAAYVLDKNMAKEPKNVYQLIETLWNPSIELAGKELNDMKAIMAKDGVKDEFQPWDWWYYADKVRSDKYALDENMIKPYFEVNNVREGVFTLLNKLFGISFEEIKNAPKYHPDMTAYKVTDVDSTLLGVLTLDLHPRATKRGGAWCSSFREQSYKDGKRVHPIIPVVCNFTAPTADSPALLSVDEASTFFHEMGHAVQGLLENVKVNGLAGTSRDFVELPSQILEEWAMHPEFLKIYAKHYQTGEVIPDELIAKMRNSSKFNKGFEMSEFLAAAYLDMEYHTIKDKTAIDAVEFEKQAMAKLGLIGQIIPRYRSTYFTHIFSGGYASGYYGYKWADVLVADAFQAFVETGDIFNPELSMKLRKDILEPWGVTSETDMYLAFRGKEADMKYLMERMF